MNEESAVIEFLQAGLTHKTFQDDLHKRVIGAFRESTGSEIDRVVLLRQLLRRWSLRDGRNVPVAIAEVLVQSMGTVPAVAGLHQRFDGMWIADPWLPDWLELDGGVPDAAASAGTEEGRRFQPEALAADGFFRAITGFEHYRSPGQRAACRAVVSAPEGSTVITMIPTGSGKTEIALCLAQRAKYGVTVIVVPTVALAYDFERRFRDHFARLNPRVKRESLNFAWTGTTDTSTRENFRRAISQGQQPLLVTSPESMTRALRQTLMAAAAIGRLQGFVIDEAHLVTQWGRFFRPEFRALADLRRDLLSRAAAGGHARAVTLLLSATLGAAEMQDLLVLFGDPGPCSPVVANALRSEPDFWISHADDPDVRVNRVLDTLAHCARPAILYVTKPEIAEQWLSRLREVGYSRIASVTGDTKPSERSAVLDDLRANSGTPRPLDLIVATSAFGLGIDYSHIRSVIHACLPETVDRWYQELGRGGRDGDACAAYLLTATGDEGEAASLGVKVLSPDVAKKRWMDLWSHKRETEELTFVDLEGARGSVQRGDYNRRWNAQVIQGLIELGELRREQFDVEDVRALLNSDYVEVADWIAVSQVLARIGAPDFWNEIWLPWQQMEMSSSQQSLSRISDLSRLRLGVCSGIAKAYAPSSQLQEGWGDRLQFMEPTALCGRCPDCRNRRIPLNEDPPPSPEQVWAVVASDYTDLFKFVGASRGVNGLAFLTYSVGEADLPSALWASLRTLGVRHVAGLPQTTKDWPGDLVFCDELPLAPMDLTPVPSFSYFQSGQILSRRWLGRRQAGRVDSYGQSLPDILLVPDGSSIGGRMIGKDIPALAGLTALELLPRG